jgi:hypothetical protein
LLGVTAWALDLLKVGWIERDKCWSFPELNHRGLIVGCNRRFTNGKKFSIVGATRGLYFADDWRDYEGPVFVVEGGSDTAAGLTMGLCVVGRPSNTGGVDYLHKLLRPVAANRKIIFIGERDAKDRGKLPERHDPNCRCCAQCYPGRFGAIQSSIRLSRGLSKERPCVRWSFMPDGAKDMRGWLNKTGVDVNSEEAMRKLKAALIRRLRPGKG